MTACRDVREAGVRRDEPLARHTTWRVGGPADRFYVPKNLAALGALLRAEGEGPCVWLGLGSNVLVRDGGVRGLVIATAGGLSEARAVAGGVYAEAGVPLAKLARLCARQGYAGLEFFAGIPGTVGGALAMNAGAAGSETWRYVDSVVTIDRAGHVRTRPAADFAVGYRSVSGPADEWFVAAQFALVPDDAFAVSARIKELLARRAQTQPLQTANAGSVFRNPPGDFAARLIEASGLKGLREGAAVVSSRHANFIVNDGGARASEIETLITRVAERVHACTGVRLEREVRIIGEAL